MQVILKMLSVVLRCGLLLAFVGVLPVSASSQESSAGSRSSVAVGAEFSANSNHLLIGHAYNRKLAGLDVTYSLALLRTKFLDWHYDIEFRPIVFIEDPVSTTVDTVRFGNGPPEGPVVVQNGLIQSRCTSSITSMPSGQPGVTSVETRVCGTRWTYAGGLSPLGQRITFLPRHAIKPYALFNAGFLVATRDTPSPDSSAFNFTFAFGGGLEFAAPKGRSFLIDYRIHHLSSAGLGYTNPGVDNQVVRLSYVLGERHRRS